MAAVRTAEAPATPGEMVAHLRAVMRDEYAYDSHTAVVDLCRRAMNFADNLGPHSVVTAKMLTRYVVALQRKYGVRGLRKIKGGQNSTPCEVCSYGVARGTARETWGGRAVRHWWCQSCGCAFKTEEV